MLIAALKAWKDLSIYTCTYIILFDNHFPFQTSVFCLSRYILGDVLDNYAQKLKKKYFKLSYNKKFIYQQKLVSIHLTCY